MGFLQWIEWILGSMLYYVRGRDHKLFFKNKAFENIESTIEVTSPECGPSGSLMHKHHSGFGGNWFPELKWKGGPPNVKEYVLVIEDPDIPLPFVATHGLFHSIPPDVDTLYPEDVQYASGREKQKELSGPLKLGKNTPRNVYIGPRPPLGHGPHRYYFELIALSEKLDDALIGDVPSKSTILKAIDGKILAWGLWIGVFQNRWEDRAQD